MAAILLNTFGSGEGTAARLVDGPPVITRPVGALFFFFFGLGVVNISCLLLVFFLEGAGEAPVAAGAAALAREAPDGGGLFFWCLCPLLCSVNFLLFILSQVHSNSNLLLVLQSKAVTGSCTYEMRCEIMNSKEVRLRRQQNRCETIQIGRA